MSLLPHAWKLQVREAGAKTMGVNHTTMPPLNDISSHADHILLYHLVHSTDGEPERAYTTIDNRYRASLIKYAIDYGYAPREVAEDCTQDVLLKLWEKRDSLNPETLQLANYLHQAVYNCTASHHKRERMNGMKGKMLLDTATHALHNHPAPDQEYETRETSSELGRALSNLEPRIRDAFRMKYGKGLSYKEIALQMGIKPSTVERQIMFARKSLKTVLVSVVCAIIVSVPVLYVRGNEIHKEIAAQPQYIDIPGVNGAGPGTVVEYDWFDRAALEVYGWVRFFDN